MHWFVFDASNRGFRLAKAKEEALLSMISQDSDFGGINYSD